MNTDRNKKNLTQKVLSLLSKKGAFKILGEAKSELLSRRDTPNKIGLSKRRYYTRLRGLKQENLIEKRGESYVLTETGKQTYALLEKLEKTLKSNKNGENLDYSSFLDDNEKEFITSYENLVETVLEIFENSSEEVLLATRYIDHQVIKEIISKSEGLDVRIIAQEFNITESFNLYKALLSPKALTKAYNLAKNHTKVVPNLPYGFSVNAQESALVEITNPLKPDEFFGAVRFRGRALSEELREMFNDIYEMTEKTPISSDGDLPSKLPLVDSLVSND
ncbi:hypothetical protein AKJ52_02675 [candidate division MSBL1 archaeon SCGC-AAA382C18]|uniref:Uncharacterized protein n=1 Tax=candidate division MSBL1 archaeon SCGC-AAA382C18 TaxID=1698281 RepID=A0A133VHX6_9EURY|nr:hypothetical protein AKJ52_02675 [candidate division MSBL1 archaeon SCGC-AAA382C18]